VYFPFRGEQRAVDINEASRTHIAKLLITS
jgi:hypothetical protein